MLIETSYATYCDTRIRVFDRHIALGQGQRCRQANECKSASREHMGDEKKQEGQESIREQSLYDRKGQ